MRLALFNAAAWSGVGLLFAVGQGGGFDRQAVADSSESTVEGREVACGSLPSVVWRTSISGRMQVGELRAGGMVFPSPDDRV